MKWILHVNRLSYCSWETFAMESFFLLRASVDLQTKAITFDFNEIVGDCMPSMEINITFNSEFFSGWNHSYVQHSKEFIRITTNKKSKSSSQRLFVCYHHHPMTWNTKYRHFSALAHAFNAFTTRLLHLRATLNSRWMGSVADGSARESLPSYSLNAYICWQRPFKAFGAFFMCARAIVYFVAPNKWQSWKTECFASKH